MTGAPTGASSWPRKSPGDAPGCPTRFFWPVSCFSHFLLGPLLLIPLAVLWQPLAPRGCLALLLTLLLGLLLPLALQVNGGSLERLAVRLQPEPVTPFAAILFSKEFLRDYRRLDLDEQVLLKERPKPETLALIRSGHWQEAQNLIEPLNLRDRHLRQAQMGWVILLGADLEGAQLQGADFDLARLQGADFHKANLYAALGNPYKSELVDATEAVWEPLPNDEYREVNKVLPTLIKDKDRREQVRQRLTAASRAEDGPSLRLHSCLARPGAPLICDKVYDPEKPEELAAFKESSRPLSAISPASLPGLRRV
jgi:hypothetical protein